MQNWVKILISFLQFLISALALYYGGTASRELAIFKTQVGPSIASPGGLPNTREKVKP